jgi:hypothetical protein
MPKIRSKLRLPTKVVITGNMQIEEDEVRMGGGGRFYNEIIIQEAGRTIEHNGSDGRKEVFPKTAKPENIAKFLWLFNGKKIRITVEEVQ